MEPIAYKFVSDTGNYWLVWEFEEDEVCAKGNGIYPMYAPIEDEV